MHYPTKSQEMFDRNSQVDPRFYKEMEKSPNLYNGVPLDNKKK